MYVGIIIRFDLPQCNFFFTISVNKLSIVSEELRYFLLLLFPLYLDLNFSFDRFIKTLVSVTGLNFFHYIKNYYFLLQVLIEISALLNFLLPWFELNRMPPVSSVHSVRLESLIFIYLVSSFWCLKNSLILNFNFFLFDNCYLFVSDLMTRK